MMDVPPPQFSTNGSGNAGTATAPGASQHQPPPPSTSTSLPAPANGCIRVLIPVPANTPSGSVLQVRGPDGAIVQCIVPSGARPGIDVFPVDYPSPTITTQSQSMSSQFAKEIWIISVPINTNGANGTNGIILGNANGKQATNQNTANSNTVNSTKNNGAQPIMSMKDLIASSGAPRRSSLVAENDPDLSAMDSRNFNTQNDGMSVQNQSTVSNIEKSKKESITTSFST